MRLLSLSQILCFFAFILSYGLAQNFTPYSTNPNRTDNVAEYCTESRLALINQVKSTDISYPSSQTNYSLGINGTAAIRYYLTGQREKGNAQLRKQYGNIVTYFVFFLIGLIILVIVGIILLFCCCCPRKCPSCECCRQPSGKPYSYCQMVAPAYFLIAFALIVTGCSIASLVLGVQLINNFRQTRCSLAILMDDYINGNVTAANKTFFIGLIQLKSDLLKLNNSIQQIKADIDPVSSNGAVTKDILHDIYQSQTEVANIPNGSGGPLILKYSGPFNSSAPTETIFSNFPIALGTYNTYNSTTSTFVGKAYAGLIVAQTEINGVAFAADTMETYIPDFQNAANSAINKVGSMIKKGYKIDSSIDSNMEKFDEVAVRIIKIILYTITILTIVFGVLIIVGTLITCCCEKSNWRHAIYFSCFFLFLLGIVTFLLTFAFSVVTPVSYYACDYLKVGLLSPSKFVYYYGPIINDDQVTQQISCCVPSGDGEIVRRLLGDNVYNFLSSLSSVIQQLNNFNGDLFSNQLDDSHSGLSSRIQRYAVSRYLDFASTPNQNILKKLANPHNYACTSPGFTEDSWVPSYQQVTVYVPCQFSGPNSTNKTCRTSSDFTTRQPNCIGCMDSSLMFSSNTTKAQVLSSLNLRYSTPDCLAFNTEFSNVWQNFYKKKLDTIQPVLDRSAAAEVNINVISGKLKNQLSNTVTQVLDKLKYDLQSIVNPQYGMIGGLNCRVLGEDVNLIITLTCDNIFVKSFILRILLAVTGYAIIFVMPFAVCLGVRHYEREKVLKFGEVVTYTAKTDHYLRESEKIIIQ